MVVGPGLDGGEPGCAVEVGVASPFPIPYAGGDGEVAANLQPVTLLGDPARQPRPAAQQRFVRHLDGRLSRRRITVEGQQPRRAEGVEQAVGLGAEGGDTLQLAARGAAAEIGVLAADGNQPEEQQTGCVLGIPLERPVDVLGARTDRRRQTADPPVVVERHRGRLPAVEQFGERELEQRQRSGPVGDSSDELGDERPVDGHPGPLGGADDRPLELGRRHSDERYRTTRHEPAETVVAERTVVEIGAQRRHDPQRRPVGFEGSDQPVDERPPDRLVGDEREQLLELVDDDQHVTAAGNGAAQRRGDPVAGRRDRCAGSTGRDLSERVVPGAERIATGRHRGDVPVLRPRDRTRAEPRYESRAHEA